MTTDAGQAVLTESTRVEFRMNPDKEPISWPGAVVAIACALCAAYVFGLMIKRL